MALLNRYSSIRALMSVVLLTIASSVQAATDASEYTVKAGFLVAFVQYTNWPEHTFVAANSPVNICILGENPFGDALSRTAREQKGRPISVRVIASVQEADDCHVAFVSRNSHDKEIQWLSELQSKSILTVGESGQSLQHGSVVELMLVNEHIHFAVNWQAMELAQIKLSSLMLEHALKVYRSNKELP